MYISTQCSPGPLPSQKKARPVAKKLTNQLKPSVTITPPSTQQGYCHSGYHDNHFISRSTSWKKLLVEVATITSIEPKALQSECRIDRIIIDERFWSFPFTPQRIHSTKNRIRDQPDHSGVCVCVCVRACVRACHIITGL